MKTTISELIGKLEKLIAGPGPGSYTEKNRRGDTKFHGEEHCKLKYKIRNRKGQLAVIMISGLMIANLISPGCKSEQKMSDGKEVKTEKYYCPMHPEVTSNKPGICPICHMDLVKQTESAAIGEGVITLSKPGELTANIQTVTIKKEQLSKEIKAYSTLEIPEQNRRIIAAKFNGRIEKLFVARTGDIIKKGEALFTVYSPDVFKTEGEFLIAASAMQNDNSPRSRQIYQAAKRKLELFGFSDGMIESLEKKGEAEYTFNYPSPVTGVIVKKKILEGAYFNEGTELYEAADLTTLWSIANVNEQDAVNLKTGLQADISIASLPGESIQGKVSFISPVIENQNRTVKVRVELNNHGSRLRPLMYGETAFRVIIGEGIAVPQEAILFTGKRNLAWLKKGEGKYEAREVKIGGRVGSRYQILGGLNEGDEILINGSYLLDSESKLKYGDGKAQAGLENQGSDSEAPKYITRNDPLFKKQGLFNKFCPVQGESVEADAPMVLYKGKIIGFCCAGCDKKFLADPEKYFKKVMEYQNK